MANYADNAFYGKSHKNDFRNDKLYLTKPIQFSCQLLTLMFTLLILRQKLNRLPLWFPVLSIMSLLQYI